MIRLRSKVMDVFIKAAEYMEIPVRRTDNEPLQKIFMLVRSELNLDLKNIKQEQAKFWKQHPALVKVVSCSQIDLVETGKASLNHNSFSFFLHSDRTFDSNSINSRGSNIISFSARRLQTCHRTRTSTP